jgi:Interferon-induced transmembrane protein
MRCPNCSAQCTDQALECEFCGETLKPVASDSEATASGKAVFTASEPSYKHPPMPTVLPAVLEKPYESGYPSSRQSSSRYQRADIPNHLIWAILSTVFCCMPAGIVAIVYAAQVEGKAASGDYEAAYVMSDKAKMWSMISFGSSIVVAVLYAMFLISFGRR